MKRIKVRIAGCSFCKETENDREKVSTPYMDISYETLGAVTGLKVFSHYCPPYGKCGSGLRSSTSFFPVDYCPYCGRKL